MATINGTPGADTLTGTADADIINALEGDDVLSGLGGNDVLDGGPGKDTLFGGEGDDVLMGGTVKFYLDRTGTSTTTADDGQADLLDGGAGNDILIGGPEDTLIGGDGDDVLTVGYRFIGGNAGGGSIDGGAGTDTITVAGGSETVRTGAGGDLVYATRGTASSPFTVTVLDFTVSGPGQDRLKLDVGQGVMTDANFPLVTAQGSDAVVMLQSFSPAQFITVVLKGVDASLLTAANFVGFTPIAPTSYHTGTDGADALIGSAGNDALSGLGGDDVLLGLAGDDVLQGGAGADRLDGGDGNDRLIGGDGADMLIGEAGNDRIEGGAGDDVISGGDGNDVIVDGESGATLQIDGGAGDDLIIVSSAKGRIDGGAGLDTLSSNNGGGIIDLSQVSVSGVEIVDGAVKGTANQLAGFTTFGSGSYLVLSAAGTLDIRGKVVPLHAAAAYATYLGGSDGADTLIGGAEPNTIEGGKGQDILTGGAGRDTFLFQAGDSVDGAIDSITDFMSGEDFLQLTTADTVSLVRVGDTATLLFDTSAGSPQTVIGINGTIQGSDIFGSGSTRGIDFVGRDNAADVLIGSGGPDRLFGLSGSDTLVGGDGDDQLFGDAGADVLTGGAGANRFAYRGFDDSNAKSGFDIITDFTPGTDKLDFSYLNGLSSVSLVRLDGGGTVAFAQTTGGLVQVGFTGAVQGSDLINPFGAPASFGYDLVGSALTEALTGSSGNDRIFGLGGNDVIFGGAGDDILYGDVGADVLTGGAGFDTFAYRSLGDSTAAGFDRITDFQIGADKLDLRGVHTSAADKYGFAVSGADTLLFYDAGGNGTNEMVIVLQNVTRLQTSDILF